MSESVGRNTNESHCCSKHCFWMCVVLCGEENKMTRWGKSGGQVKVAELVKDLISNLL